MNVSLIASSVRPQLYESFFKSLEGTSCSYEVVFAGNCTEEEIVFNFPLARGKYIHTKNIKPCQCYDLARRNAIGEVIVWTADDAEVKGDILSKAYSYWKKQNNKKLILSLQTREFYLDGGDGFCDMKKHAFHGGDADTPLMAPLAMISREYLQELGGFDRRFICGQMENLCVMMAYQDGAKVEIFGDRESYIEIDHINKSKECGESKNHKEFLNRPFARGYEHDRKILESVCKYENNKIEVLNFEPYEEKDIKIKSQSHKGEWE